MAILSLFLRDGSGLAVLRMGASLLIFFFIPGFAIGEIFIKNRERDWLETAVLSFALGLAALMPLAILLTYLGAELGKLILLYQVGVSVLVFVAAIRWLGRREAYPAVRSKQKTLVEQYALLALLAFFALLALRIGAAVHPYNADSFFHLASARKLLELPRLSPGNPFYAGSSPDSVYGYNGWHLALAILSRNTGLDLLVIWRLLPLFLGWLFGSSVYVLVKQLTKNRQVALSAAILYVLVSGLVEAGGIWYIAPFPSTVASLILVPVFFSLFTNRDIEGLPKSIMLGLVSFALGVVHFFTLVFALLFLLTYLGVSYIFDVRRRLGGSFPVREVLATLLGAAAPAMIRMYLFQLSPTEHVLAEWLRQGSRQVLYVNEFFFLENPLRRFAVDPLLVIAVAGMPFFFRQARRGSIGGAFAFGALALSLSINFNPVVLPLVSRLMPLPLWLRLFDVIPSAVPAGLFLFMGADERRLNHGTKWLRGAVAIALVVIAVATINPRSMPNRPTGIPIYRLIFHPPPREPFPGIALATRRLERVLKTNKPTIIISDPLTSQVVPAYMNVYVVEIVDNAQRYTTAFKYGAALRLADLSKIFDPTVGFPATRNLIRKYGGEIVLANRDVPGFSDTKFHEDPHFGLIFDDGRYAAYRVR